MKIPQIDYTSRDYLSLREDLIRVVQNRIPEWQANEESDFTLALVEAFAYIADNLSYYLDRVANESSVQTSTQLQNLINFAEVAGYHVSSPSPAYISLQFTNTSGAALDLPIGTQVKGYIDSGDFTEIYFETAATISNLANNATATVTAFEGYVANTTSSSGLDINNLPLPVTLGNASGYAYHETVIPEIGVVDLSVDVYTGQSYSFTKWEYVSNLAEYGPSDRVFTTRLNADRTTSILFGDGVNGKIPEKDTPISALYRISLGKFGNLALSSSTLQQLSVSYVPGQSLSAAFNLASVTALTASTGGTDGDLQAPYYSLRANIKKALKTKNRAVTLKDYEDLAVLIPRVGRASAISSVYTNVTLYVQPLKSDSATPGVIGGVEDTTVFAPIREAVKTFIEPRSPVNTTLTVLPPTYVPIYLNMTVYIKDSYSKSDVQLDVANLMLNDKTGLFSYNGYAFGEDALISAITYEIMRHPAVNNVVINGLAKILTNSTKTITGTSGTNTITVDTNTGLVAGQYVYGTGISAGTKIASGGISGTTITLTNNNTAAVSGTGYFFTNAPADVTIGDSEIVSLTADKLSINISGGV